MIGRRLHDNDPIRCLRNFQKNFSKPHSIGVRRRPPRKQSLLFLSSISGVFSDTVDTARLARKAPDDWARQRNQGFQCECGEIDLRGDQRLEKHYGDPASSGLSLTSVVTADLNIRIPIIHGTLLGGSLRNEHVAAALTLVALRQSAPNKCRFTAQCAVTR